METASTGILIVLGLVAFNNYKSGQLGDWLRAKFFNQVPQTPDEVARSVLEGAAAELERQRAAGGGAVAVPQSYGSGGVGVLLAPVAGPVTSSCGQRDGRLHAGIDFAVPSGTPVHAVRAGRVISAGAAGGYGLKVDVDHGGGFVTRYAHLSRLDVRVGDQVTAGATIGLSGNTGRSTGPHLHFETRIGGIAKDPAGYLAGTGAGTVSA